MARRCGRWRWPAWARPGLPRYHVEPDIAAGRLRPILEDWNPGDTQFVHAVFVGHAHLAARIRAFVDFLADQGPVNRPLTSP